MSSTTSFTSTRGRFRTRVPRSRRRRACAAGRRAGSDFRSRARNSGRNVRRSCSIAARYTSCAGSSRASRAATRSSRAPRPPASSCRRAAVRAVTSSGSRRELGAPPRLDSLDVFRGLTVAAMILVSTPGTWDAVYPALEHAPWNGWTLADLVFPFFLFAMGAAVPFALARRKAAARRVHTHVVRRAVVLFGLGILLNAIVTPPPLALLTLRIPGVLQRIAIVFAIVSSITQRLRTRTQMITAAAMLARYWVVL